LITLFGAALLLASAGYARAANKGTLHLTDTLSVAGHTLTPGDYKVEWNGSRPDARSGIAFLRDSLPQDRCVCFAWSAYLDAINHSPDTSKS